MNKALPMLSSCSVPTLELDAGSVADAEGDREYHRKRKHKRRRLYSDLNGHSTKYLRFALPVKERINSARKAKYGSYLRDPPATDILIDDMKPNIDAFRRNISEPDICFGMGTSSWQRSGASRWGGLAPPENVHSADWRDMVLLSELGPGISSGNISSVLQERKVTEAHCDGSLQSSGHAGGAAALQHWRWSGSDLSLQRQHWITETFLRRECAKFLPTSKDPHKCGCGRVRHAHFDLAHLTSAFLSCRTDYTDKGALKEVDEEEEERAYVMICTGNRFLPEVNPLRSSARKSARTTGERWSIKKHTMCLPTNAFGQIEFQGAAHPYRAQYVRLSFDTDPANIMALFEHIWNIEPPKLIITIHGGMTNFDIQQKLSRVFRKGLLKAAKTTGAWIITSGVDAGVVRHVAAALEGGSSSRSRIVCIGITPWGLLKKREDLLGKDVVVAYHPHSFHAKSRCAVLNNRNSFFLLVDNGTVGRFGADVILRRRLEMYIAQKQKIFGGTRSVPVVGVILEGGACTIRTVLDYVTSIPRVPVVVCDGSGRASDLLAFAHQQVQEDGSFSEHVRLQLLSLIQRTFAFDERSAEKVLRELSICAQQKDLVTVFRLGEKGKHDVDYAILTALLKGQNLSGPDQLALALAWNRVDIAKSDIFGAEQQHAWSQAALNNAMMEALIHDRVDFVRLLIENGVSMQKFLNIGRLEELYNTDKGPPNTLYYIVRDVVKMKPGYHYKLPHIGMAIEKLMANAYRSNYTSTDFRTKYNVFMKKFRARHQLAPSSMTRTNRASSAALTRQATEPCISMPGGPDGGVSESMVSALSGSRALSNHILWRSAFRNFNTIAMRPPNLNETKEAMLDDEEMSTSGSTSERSLSEFEFRYPFSELLLWAVLTKRQEMALCMWEHGEEALAKSLIACRLYKSLAKEAAEDYLEVEICEELKKYAEEFRVLSLELLDHVYSQDDALALQLLTYELRQWSSETCLSLAVIVNNKHFLAHPCCQILLADLWHGGLRIRSHSNAKVIVGLLLPFTIPALEFKTREELLLQPQTAAEHEQDINDTSSSSSSSSSDDSSSSSFSDSDEEHDLPNAAGRRTSHSSMQSLNHLHPIGSLFRGRKRGVRPREKPEDTVASVEAGLHKCSVASSNGSPQAIRKRPRAHSSSRSKNGNLANGYASTGDLRRRTSSVASLGSRDLKEDYPSKHPLRNLLPGNLQRMKKIKFRRRFYEFYAAPITTFWSWTISFCLFICCLTYMLLVKTPPKPTVLEWILLSYVVSFGMEHTRKFMASDMEPFSQKVKYFFFNYWNTVTALAVITYITGFVMRTVGFLGYGRVVLACNSVLWVMKMLDYMSVHPRLGPYITMAGKMVLSMSYIIVMLVVSLLAFGLARQSITFPNEEWHPLLLRNIFYKPYFMLYGEVYADEIDSCGDDAWDQHNENGSSLWYLTGKSAACVPGNWIPPILMTFFLLVANVLLMSMLIAIFNNIFDSTEEFSQQIWLFQRYRQVMEYESTPFFPPPFTVLWHACMVVKYIRWRCRKPDPNSTDKDLFDFSLKLFLSPEQVEKLHDFEEDCMEELGRKKEHERNASNEQRILRTAERTDLMMARLGDLTSKESILRGDLQTMENRLELIENRQEEILDSVRQLTAALPLLLTQALATVGRAPSPAHSIQLRGDSIDEPSIVLNVPSVEPDLTTAPGSRIRQRTATICDPGVHEADTKLLSPAPAADHCRSGSLNNLSQNLVNASGALGAVTGSSFGNTRRDISMSFRRRHEEYTSITDGISITEEGKRVDLRESDEELSAGGADDDMFRGRNHHTRSPSQNQKMKQIFRLAEEASRHDSEALADSELTELEREDDEKGSATEADDQVRSKRSSEAEGLTFSICQASDNRTGSSNVPSPPEPRPSPELGSRRSTQYYSKVE